MLGQGQISIELLLFSHFNQILRNTLFLLIFLRENTSTLCGDFLDSPSLPLCGCHKCGRLKPYTFSAFKFVQHYISCALKFAHFKLAHLTKFGQNPLKSCVFCMKMFLKNDKILKFTQHLHSRTLGCAKINAARI